MTVQPVTVGFDGSESSRRALAWALQEAAQRHRPMRVVYCLVSPVTITGFDYAPMQDLSYLDALSKSADALMAEAVEKARAELADVPGTQGVEIEPHVIVGSPSSVLIEQSRDSHLLVVGSRGYGGFRGLLLGSVGVQTASHSACPAVVVRGPSPAGARTVVVGVDGSPMSREALRFGFDFASRHSFDLVAVHAWELPTYDMLAAPAGPAPALFADIADDEMRVTAEQLAGFGQDYPDVAVEECLVKSPPVHGLLEAGGNAAVIVVGSRGRGEFLGTLLGSVSQGVLHRAKVPVVVVHPAEGEHAGSERSGSQRRGGES